MKLDLLIDVDSITADLWTEWLRRYNQDYGPGGRITDGFEVTIDMIKSFGLHDVVHPECKYKIYDYLDGDLFASLEPKQGAVEGVKELQDMGHNVFFVTSPSANPQSSAAKQVWLKEHFPNVKRQNIFLCHRKGMIKGHVLFDDGPHNLKEYKEANPDAYTVTITYPYNKDVEVDYRCGDYTNPGKAWSNFVQYVDTLDRLGVFLGE